MIRRSPVIALTLKSFHDVKFFTLITLAVLAGLDYLFSKGSAPIEIGFWLLVLATAFAVPTFGSIMAGEDATSDTQQLLFTLRTTRLRLAVQRFLHGILLVLLFFALGAAIIALFWRKDLDTIGSELVKYRNAGTELRIFLNYFSVLVILPAVLGYNFAFLISGFLKSRALQRGARVLAIGLSYTVCYFVFKNFFSLKIHKQSSQYFMARNFEAILKLFHVSAIQVAIVLVVSLLICCLGIWVYSRREV
jgi:hypothetical protein